MRFFSFFLGISFVASSFAALAQDIDSRILLTVDGRRVEAGEFVRMYRKSLEPGKTEDPAKYLEQFIVFKLKVADAIHAGIDTTISFRNELGGYRQQLAQGYLTDNKTRELFIENALKRSLTEVSASHILVGINAAATPSDTLASFNKAVQIRERIIAGEPFETLAATLSDDPSARINMGNLGYFTVFQMISPFEEAAYTLKPGEISQPVRTPYGYHIIKVNGRRNSQGKVRVAHIMKAAPPGSDSVKTADAEAAIRDIYEKLKKGASFKTLATEFSDHKESALKGGELNWFGTGEIISEFAEAAIALKDTGSYTEPVRTPYGWHIIKLLERKPPLSQEEARSSIESRISSEYLAELSRKAFIENLKKTYNFRINSEVTNWFVKNTDSLILKGNGKFNRKKIPAGNVYTFSDRSLTAREFADYTEKKGYSDNSADAPGFVQTLLEQKSSEQLLSYENSLLEKKYPEFRYLMNEFHDGILLFEISGRKVWNRVSSDTAGLNNYYERQKSLLRPEPSGIDEVREQIMKGYQDFLESEWVEQLKQRYAVKVNEAVKEEVFRSLKDE